MRVRGTRGQIVSVYAIALPVLLGFLALALDGGKLWVTKVQLQNAADAAALGSALDLGPCSSGCDADPVAEAGVRSNVEAAVNGYSNKNGGPSTLPTCAAAWYKTNHGTDPPRNSTNVTGCYMWPYLRSSPGSDPNCLPSTVDPGSFACWDQVEVRIRKPIDLEFARVVRFRNPAYPFARSVGTFIPQVVFDPGNPGTPDQFFTTTYFSTISGATHTTTTPAQTITNTTTTSHFVGGTGAVAFVMSTDCLNAPATATVAAGAAFQWSGAPSTLNQLLVNGGMNIDGANRHHSDHIWLGKKGVAGCERYGSGANVTTITGPFAPLDWPVPPPPAPPAGCTSTGGGTITASWKTTHGPGIYCWTGPLTVSANSTVFNGYSFYAPRIIVNSNSMTVTNAPPASGEPPTVFYAYGFDVTDPVTGLDSCAVGGGASNCAFSFNGGSNSITGDIFVPNGTISLSGGGASVNGGTGFMESQKLIVSGNFSSYNGTGPGDGGTITTTTETTTTVIPATTQTTTDPDTTTPTSTQTVTIIGTPSTPATTQTVGTGGGLGE